MARNNNYKNNNLAIVSRFHLEQSLPQNILLEEEIDIEAARSNILL